MTKTTTRNPRPLYRSSDRDGQIQITSPSTSVRWLKEALVVDVIVDNLHEDVVNGGYNIGCVLFRDINSDIYRPREDLHWAFPLETTLTEYPLKNEIIHVFESLGRFYYARKINVGNTPTHQAFFGLENEMATTENTGDSQDILNRSQANPVNVTYEIENQLGEYFKNLPDVRSLLHWEGDVIIEGRSGQSIRLGTSWKDERIHKNIFKSSVEDQSPNLLLRIGQNSDPDIFGGSLYGRVVEDINADKSSFWMVSDQVVPLRHTTQRLSYLHNRSILDAPSQYSGNQILINTDRLVLNTKSDKILMYSGRGFHVTTLSDSTMDVEKNKIGFTGEKRFEEIVADDVLNVGRDSLYWTGRNLFNQVKENASFYVDKVVNLHGGTKISLISPKIYIGSSNNNREPMVLGKSLVRALTRFIDAHLQNAGTHVITPIGPGALSGEIVKSLTTLRNELEQLILSEDNFVSKTNESPVRAENRILIQQRLQTAR